MNPIILLASLAFALAGQAAEPLPQPVAFRVGPLLFDRPADWQWVKPEGSFRVAQLEKTGSGKNPMVMAFSRFPAGAGGNVQANIERWVRQFSRTSSPAEVQTLTASSGPVTRVKIRGSLNGGTPGGPAKEIPDALLLGAILETDEGTIVVKLAGPNSALAAEEKTFSNLISAATAKKSNP